MSESTTILQIVFRFIDGLTTALLGTAFCMIHLCLCSSEIRVVAPLLLLNSNPACLSNIKIVFSENSADIYQLILAVTETNRFGMFQYVDAITRFDPLDHVFTVWCSINQINTSLIQRYGIE
jgi:hypothetical protein